MPVSQDCHSFYQSRSGQEFRDPVSYFNRENLIQSVG